MSDDDRRAWLAIADEFRILRGDPDAADAIVAAVTRPSLLDAITKETR